MERFEKGLALSMAGRQMPRKKEKRKEVVDVVDSFESWLEKQPSKPVLAKHGFLADAKIE